MPDRAETAWERPEHVFINRSPRPLDRYNPVKRTAAVADENAV
jgi:hypothetical protein